MGVGRGEADALPFYPQPSPQTFLSLIATNLSALAMIPFVSLLLSEYCCTLLFKKIVQILARE
jgi:hypothetical protein